MQRLWCATCSFILPFMDHIPCRIEERREEHIIQYCGDYISASALSTKIKVVLKQLLSIDYSLIALNVKIK